MADERDRKPEDVNEEQDSSEGDEESVTGAPVSDEDEDPNLLADDEEDDDDNIPDDDDEPGEEDIPESDDVVEKSASVDAEPDDGSETDDEPEPDADEDETDADEAPAAATRRDTEITERIGVLLMAYGGPDKLEDVPDYLLDVRSGRPMEQELIDEFVDRYGQIGGRSPILELTQAQAKGVEKALNNRKAREKGIEYKTYVGMRHWHPYIRDVVPQLVEDGVDKIVGVVMAPHYSSMSVGKYMDQLHEGIEKAGATIPVYEVHSWKDQPMFVSGVSSRIRDELRKFPADIRKDIPVVFTAHSLPTRILEWGDPYPDELRISVELVADRVRQRHWRFAYQSQGASAEPWLGPTVEETLEDLAAEGFKHVLMVPFGFVCDHVEILYDVDIEHKEHAEKLGMELRRIRSLNDGPMLCRAVAEAVRKAHDPTHVAEEVEETEAAAVGNGD